MTISILNYGYQYDLPSDIQLNIEMVSPILSKGGSMSLPISLPLTKNNRMLLSYPDRLDIYNIATGHNHYGLQDNVPVLVKQGSWQQEATMSITSCSDTSIEVTLYFNESNIWSTMEDVTLPKAMGDLHFGDKPTSEADIPNKRSALFASPGLYDHMVPMGISASEMDTWLQSHDFVVAPLYTKDGWLNELACVDRHVYGSSGQDYLYENPLTGVYTSDVGKRFFRLKAEYPWYTTSALKGKTSPVYMSSGVRVVGYQNKNQHLYCTGFLRLDVVLRQIFSHLGYTLQYDFTTSWPYATIDGEQTLERLWNKIIVLNNTMDAIWPGCIYYSTLVPEVSCKEFILAVQAQFGVVFSAQPGTKNIIMRFSETIIKQYTQIQKIEDYHDKQINFLTSPDYSPSDGMDKVDGPDYSDECKADSLKDISLLSHISALNSDNLPSFILDGVCQRTTTTVIDGVDSTKSNKCPIAFGICTQSRESIVYSPGVDTTHYYTPVILNYDDLYSRDWTQRQLYINNKEDGLYKELNTIYNGAFSEGNCDTVTISKMLSMYELANIDFSVPYIIQGRLCWLLSIQYKMENKNKQQATMKFAAPRKRLQN